MNERIALDILAGRPALVGGPGVASEPEPIDVD